MRCPDAACSGLMVRVDDGWRCAVCGRRQLDPKPAALISWRECGQLVLIVLIMGAAVAGGWWAGGGIGVAVGVLVAGGVLDLVI